MVKKSAAEITILWIFFVLFVIYAITLLFPVAWCLNNSFKYQKEFMLNTWSFPKEFTIANWISSFEREIEGTNLAGMFVNSIILIVGCSFCSIGSSAVTAYCLAKYNFRGKGAFYSLAVVLMMIPSTGSTAAIYKMFFQIGLYDTFFGIFIMNLGGFGSGFLLLYGFFKNLPVELCGGGVYRRSVPFPGIFYRHAADGGPGDSRGGDSYLYRHMERLLYRLHVCAFHHHGGVRHAEACRADLL